MMHTLTSGITTDGIGAPTEPWEKNSLAKEEPKTDSIINMSVPKSYEEGGRSSTDRLGRVPRRRTPTLGWWPRVL